MNLSRRVTSLRASSTVAVTARAKALRAQGHDVLSFAAGEPDFDTPQPIKDAALKALQSGLTSYAPTPGDPETRGVIAEKLRRENRLPDLAADHVVVTSGGKQALYLLFQCLLDQPAPGENPREVLLPVPAWVTYAPQAELAGGRVVEIPAGPDQGFKITPDQLREAITPRSRILVFNSPSNPCGVMYTPGEVDAIAKVVEEAAETTAPDLVVITDEIYEKLIYGDAPHKSMGSIKSIAERTVTVNGMSKAFAMTGWRLGYLAGSGTFGQQVASATAKMQGQINTAVVHFLLPAIRAALTECAADVERMRDAFAKRGALMHERIAALPGMNCPEPTGAFYVFPDVSAHFGKRSAGGHPINTALDFAQALLDEQRVACVPGEDFGGCGGDCVRFSFACSESQISEGMDRLDAFLKGLR